MNIFNKGVTFVKSHPLGTAAIVAAIFAVILLLRRGGGGGEQAQDLGVNYGQILDSQAASVQAGNQLQIATLQAQTEAKRIDAESAIAGQQAAAAVSIADLQGKYSTTQYQIQGDVAKTLATLQTQGDVQISTLQAQVQQAQINAEVEKEKNQTLALSTISKTNADTTLALVQATTQQIGVNGIIHTAAQNQTEVALRGEGYSGAFGAGGGDAFLINKYGREGAKKWYSDRGVKSGIL